jgi:hypothetical protein
MCSAWSTCGEIAVFNTHHALITVRKDTGPAGGHRTHEAF